MKLYLAGPMRGLPYFNYPKFKIAREKLRADGHIVFCPAEHTIGVLGFDPSANNPHGDETMIEGFDRRAAFAENLAWICRQAEGITLLGGWKQSSGAVSEYWTARALGLSILTLPDSELQP